ncbi:hypothetical protein ACFQ23_05565 [Schaalia naturae]|uniref:Uncharacterized protein n=1 Tax=Schaalia naturae TaxID=635203 RepID=A0ABW2SQW9_9ACTO
MATNEDTRTFNPMAYDVLLELATRIGGQYVAWAEEAPSEASGRHWRNAGIEMQRQVRAVDPHSRSAIESKTEELRAMLATMPAHAPLLTA